MSTYYERNKEKIKARSSKRYYQNREAILTRQRTKTANKAPRYVYTQDEVGDYIVLISSFRHGGFTVRFSAIDLPLFQSQIWSISKMGKFHDLFYLTCKARGLFHRAALNVQVDMIIDHINGNGLDNRIENIRPISRQHNMSKSKKRASPTSSRHRGVSRSSTYRKWLSIIYFNGARKHLGYFVSENEAAKAYNDAALLYFGEYARLNVIQELKRETN